MDQDSSRGSGLRAGDHRGRGVGWKPCSPAVHLGTVPGLATGVGLSNPTPWLCDFGQLSEAL